MAIGGGWCHSPKAAPKVPPVDSAGGGCSGLGGHKPVEGRDALLLMAMIAMMLMMVVVVVVVVVVVAAVVVVVVLVAAAAAVVAAVVVVAVVGMIGMIVVHCHRYCQYHCCYHYNHDPLKLLLLLLIFGYHD